MSELTGARASALAAGVLLLAGLIAYNGAGDIFQATAAAGYGLLVVALFHILPLVADALGWRCLLRPQPSVSTMVRLRWIGESINGLLPVFQVGGSVVKAQLLARQGVAGSRAGASVVVDVTTLAASQVVFTVLGLVLLLRVVGGLSLAWPLAAAAALMALAVVAFAVLQRRGLFGGAVRALGRLTRGAGRSIESQAEALDTEVGRLYGDRAALAASVVWHLVAWLLGAGEVWLALWFLGHPVGLDTAFLLESLGQAVRVAAFAVPGALGVQEGGYLVLGRIVGLAPDTCLALSLSKRVRELILGVPGLVVWQWEGAVPRRQA